MMEMSTASAAHYNMALLPKGLYGSFNKGFYCGGLKKQLLERINKL